MSAILVDSGFLVALGIGRDPRHKAARAFLSAYRGELLVPAPVVTETCYFLTTANKVRLLDWLTTPKRKVLEVPASAYPEIAAILTRYEKLDPGFTDAAIVWLAGEARCPAVLTVDARDFAVFRFGRNRRFDVLKW